MRILIVALLLFTMSCRSGPLRPAAIEKDDVCMRCKMAISQPQYAAQFVDKQGNHYKFDDIGCMLAFVRQRSLKSSDLTFFFMDYTNTAHWLDATTAVLVKSARIESPMASGLAAFDSGRAANDFAAKNQGQVLAVAEVLGAENNRTEMKQYVQPTSTPK